MAMLSSVMRAIGSAARRLGRAVGGLIRGTAEQAGVAQTMTQDGPPAHITAIGGAMMVGAARRIGKATNEMPDEQDPERDWRDR
jgi:hypothetical protein